MNDLYSSMKAIFLRQMEAAPLELVSLSEEKREKRDSQNKTSIGMENFVRVSVEVPRGNGILSRLRFDVKIPDGQLKVTEEELAEKKFAVSFVDLKISYIDSSNRRVYFRASDYSLKEVE